MKCCDNCPNKTEGYFRFMYRGHEWIVHQRQHNKEYSVHIRKDGEHIDRATTNKLIGSEEEAKKIVENYLGGHE